jgi:hypothetical protein
MAKLAWTPWHKAVTLREDIRSGELSLATFAADLYDVVMGKAKPVYQKPEEFFALTYPTYNLRELAKDVVTRLAGKSEKAVRQLELTYGGGKTHTLITLFHLVNETTTLPDLTAVKEFKEHIGMKTLPKARIAALSFDKLDVEKGMEVRGPKGEKRWLKNPWSVVAFQIAGAQGLKILNSEDRDAERETAPAENLLTELLELPGKEGLSTLILIDEVLMYAREKIGQDPEWRSRLVNFFQYLTQAVTKVDRAAIVASLLATDPRKSDELGREITAELYAIFRRESEEGVQPVGKDDVAEVLRRRFFTAESTANREGFRGHVVAALKGIGDLDEQVKKEGKTIEDRFFASYPFNPALTDVFYGKWTQLSSFQRTRGILRTFAMALRESEPWDESPLIGPNVFLTTPDRDGLSEALLELSRTAAEVHEGKKQEWTGILESEIEKARAIQANSTGVAFREVEQAVAGTFLHSQPAGQKASTRELMYLLGPTRPDKIGLEKALRSWAETSWFLDEESIGDVDPADPTRMPRTWRLGDRPNLRQMHAEACRSVTSDLISARLIDETSRLRSLSAGAQAAGARVHTLPDRPRDVEDDGEFHFAILGSKAASESGKPSPEAVRFLNETTAPERPRVNKNALVLAVPQKEGLDVARNAIKEHLGWEQVREQVKGKELDPIRVATLGANADAAKRKIPDAIQQAYSIVVTISDRGEPQAFKITTTSDPLFTTIKSDPRARIQEQAINAEALLPGGPYDQWRGSETARRAKDLVGAFASNPKLPKMLNRSAILDTLLDACRSGLVVLRLARPDGSIRTWWMDVPDDDVAKDAALEVVLPGAAELIEVPATALLPDHLPDLWKGPEINYREILDYFKGGRVVKVSRGTYDEPFAIPKAEPAAIDAAVVSAVRNGHLWLTSGPASILGEEIPTGLLTPDARLRKPPESISSKDLLPDVLSDAWKDGASTALAISAALSQRAGETLPWTTVRDAIDGGFRSRFFERSLDSGPWPCDAAGAGAVKLKTVDAAAVPPPPAASQRKPGVLIAKATLRPSQIQDLADHIGEITKTAVGAKLEFRIEVELEQTTQSDASEKVNRLLKEISSDLKLE